MRQHNTFQIVLSLAALCQHAWAADKISTRVEPLDGDPFQRPGSGGALAGDYFQGDILADYDQIASRFGTKVAKRVSSDRAYLRGRRLGIMEDLEARWPRNQNDIVVVPYEIADGSLDSSLIENVMQDIEARTGGMFSFVERVSETDYVSFQTIGSGCFSRIGMHGGQQPINLGEAECRTFAIIQHEILHTLGFWHEHTRPDRDQFVQVNEEHILIGKEADFVTQQTLPTTSAYDYGSIMHPTNAFNAVLQTSTTTKNFCTRIGLITFTTFQPIKAYCLAPQNSVNPTSGMLVDFFECASLPNSGEDALWTIQSRAGATQLKYTESNQNLCLKAVAGPNLDFTGTSTLVLGSCAAAELSLDEKATLFQFTAEPETSGDILLSRIRLDGDPSLCLDWEGAFLETRPCHDLVGQGNAQEQRWTYQQVRSAGCQGIQFLSSYSGGFPLEETLVTIPTTVPIGVATAASATDITQLIELYNAEFTISALSLELPVETIVGGTCGGFVVLVALAMYVRARQKRRRRRRLQRARNADDRDDSISEHIGHTSFEFQPAPMRKGYFGRSKSNRDNATSSRTSKQKSSQKSRNGGRTERGFRQGGVNNTAASQGQPRSNAGTKPVVTKGQLKSKARTKKAPATKDQPKSKTGAKKTKDQPKTKGQPKSKTVAKKPAVTKEQPKSKSGAKKTKGQPKSKTVSKRPAETKDQPKSKAGQKKGKAESGFRQAGNRNAATRGRPKTGRGARKPSKSKSKSKSKSRSKSKSKT